MTPNRGRRALGFRLWCREREREGEGMREGTTRFLFFFFQREGSRGERKEHLGLFLIFCIKLFSFLYYHFFSRNELWGAKKAPRFASFHLMGEAFWLHPFKVFFFAFFY